MAFLENSIIVFTDLLQPEEQCLTELKQSISFAKMVEAKIYLVSISNDSISNADEKLKKIAKEVSEEAGFEILSEILSVKSYKDVVKYAEKIEPHLLILDSKIFFSIENAHKLARKSPCPVLILKTKSKIDYKTIILPLDLTKESREKVSNAITFGKYFHSLVKVLAVRLNDEIEYENKLISYTHQVKNFIKEKGIDTTIKTLAGEDISKLVIDYCNAKEGDLIMIINDPLIGLTEMFKGTTAQKIIDQSEISVLSIPPIIRKDTSLSTTPY